MAEIEPLSLTEEKSREYLIERFAERRLTVPEDVFEGIRLGF
ncbi:MAG: hypothetical protein ACRDF4_05210 [Rhabdochlamydiaceae bacterium]